MSFFLKIEKYTTKKLKSFHTQHSIKRFINKRFHNNVQKNLTHFKKKVNGRKVEISAKRCQPNQITIKLEKN